MKKPTIELLDCDFLDPDLYYTNPIISNSGLGSFWCKLIGTQAMKAKPETLRFGNLMHLGLYQQYEFMSSKEYVDFYSRQNIGYDKTFRQCERMIEAGRKTPVLGGFLKNKATIYEKPYYAIINGVPVKVKPDAFIPKSRLGHDAKSTATNSLEAFLVSMKEYGYWRQAALYMDATGAKNWYFTAICKAEPHKTFIIDCSKYKAEVQQGRIEYLEFLRLYVQYHPNYLKNAYEYINKEFAFV